MSDRDRVSTRETTPIGTPRGFAAGPGVSRKAEREKDSLFPWSHNKTTAFSTNTGSYVDDALLEFDNDDPIFPLFDEPWRQEVMESRTTPINIAASSNVHSSGGNDSRPSGAINIGGGQSRAMNAVFGRRESNSGTLAPGSHSGAQPISVNSGGRARRESLAGSMVTGMSWGGASVSSWIRDE